MANGQLQRCLHLPGLQRWRSWGEKGKYQLTLERLFPRAGLWPHSVLAGQQERAQSSPASGQQEESQARSLDSVHQAPPERRQTPTAPAGQVAMAGTFLS